MQSPEAEIEKNISDLSTQSWVDLEELYSRVINHKGPFSLENPRNTDSDGVIHMPFRIAEPIIHDIRDYFGEHNLVVPFDWVHWDEGVEMINRKDNDFSNTSAIDVIKLFTMIIRSDRFNEGAFTSLFDYGVGAKLLKRLIEFKPN